MTFDSKTNTIRVSAQGDFSADSGALFAKILRDMTHECRDPENPAHRQLAADWALLESWLGCGGREPTDADYAKVGIIWRSYLGGGQAPSLALENAFIQFAKQAKLQQWPVTKVPPDISSVFDRVLATDGDIKVMRARRAVAVGESLRALGDAARASQRPIGPIERARRWFAATRRDSRLIIGVSAVWLIYSLWRTSGSYELIGIWLDSWDSDAFLLNAFLPPVALTLGVKLYRWISSAK